MSRIVLPLVLKIETFSEPGAILMFKDIFGVRYDKEVSGQHLKRSLTIIKEDSESPLLPEAIYHEQVLPFIKKSLSLRQYDARLICLQLLDKYISQLIDWDASCLSLVVDELLLGLEDLDMDIYILSLQGLCSVLPRCLDLKESSRSDKKVEESAKKVENMKPVRGLRGSKTRSSLSSLLQYASDSKILGEDNTGKNRTEGNTDLIPNVPLPATLVENVMIPHVLKACVDDAILPELRWSLLDSIVELWKYLTIRGAKTRVCY